MSLKTFFSVTVATIGFAKKSKGHGWLGIRFQSDPQEDFSEILLHIQFHENSAVLQQITSGILGVNLIYGAYYHHDNPTQLLKSLYFNLDTHRIEIDTINFMGPLFEMVGNRLISLQLMKNDMTQAVMSILMPTF